MEELQELLEEDPDKKRKLVMCKDEAGVGLLHKAVYHDLKKIYRWLIQNFPALAPIKDSVSHGFKEKLNLTENTLL